MQTKLCLLTDSRKPSGVGEVMLTLAAELSREYEVCFVCPSIGGGARLLGRARALGIKAFPFDVLERGPELDRFADWLRSSRIQILNVHAGVGWEGIQAVHAARSAGVRAVVRTEHLPFLLTDTSQREEYSRMVRKLDRLLCVSDCVRESHILAGVPTELAHTVRNGVYPRSPVPDRKAVESEFGLGRGSRVILTIGRMTEQKGYGFLLQAAPRILASYPQARFIWVGDGPLESELRGQAEELGIANSIRFVGGSSDVGRLMASSDLLVLPSLFEGLPLVILEAMAIGIPVIATEICGTCEVIVDSVSGRLVEPGNPLAIAEAIVQALDQPQLAARWSQEGCARFARDFHAARMARETASHFAQLRTSQYAAAPSRYMEGIESSACQSRRLSS